MADIFISYARPDREKIAALSAALEQAMDEFSPVHFVHIRNDVAFDRYRDLPRYRAPDARYEAWRSAQPEASN